MKQWVFWMFPIHLSRQHLQLSSPALWPRRPLVESSHEVTPVEMDGWSRDWRLKARCSSSGSLPTESLWFGSGAPYQLLPFSRPRVVTASWLLLAPGFCTIWFLFLSPWLFPTILLGSSLCLWRLNTDGLSIPYKTNKLKLPLFLKRIVSVYFSIFLLGFGSMSLIFRVLLCQPGRVEWGGRWGGGSKQRGYMHTYVWLMLMFDRKQQNSVKQLSFD